MGFKMVKKLHSTFASFSTPLTMKKVLSKNSAHNQQLSDFSIFLSEIITTLICRILSLFFFNRWKIRSCKSLVSFRQRCLGQLSKGHFRCQGINSRILLSTRNVCQYEWLQVSSQEFYRFDYLFFS